MKITKSLFLVFCFVFLSQIACLAQAPNVPTNNLSVAGLQTKVIVRRDARGIPYIEAASEADLYFAQGFVTAQDRLWQMDLYRRVARGETAEIFGGVVLEEDKRWRKFGFAPVAEEAFRLLRAEERAALEAYARGVNAFIAALDEKTLPIEFKILQYRPREWRAEDSIVIGKILADALSNTWRIDLLKAASGDLPEDKRRELFNLSSPHDVLLVGTDGEKTENGKRKTENAALVKADVQTLDALARADAIRQRSLERIGFHAEDLAASNNWVVSGKRTIDGKPLLANDPHLRAAQPPIWYMVNLSAGDFRVAGVTVPGAPGVILGHNANIAWGATNVGPDVQDLYLETFDASNSRRYKTPTGWREAETRREEIKVRKSPLAPETESQFLEVVTTRNGIVFFEENGKRYSLRWTALDPKNNEFSAFGLLNRARNWDDFKNALKTYGGAMQNFIYADTQGNIGWIAAGRVPKRKTGDGSLPYDGSTDDGAWTRFIPFEELPQLYNPPDGLIVTANQRIVGKSYPHQELVRAFDSPFRARRIYDLLTAKSKLTADDFQAIQHDVHSIPLIRFAREVVNLKAASGETLRLLSAWDGRLTADSKAALLVNEMRQNFRAKILTANFGAANYRGIMESAFFDRLIAEKPTNWLPKEFKDYGELLKATEKDARASLTKRFGADEAKLTWGEANKIRFPHPLAGAPLVGGQFAIDALPQIGGRDVPNVGAGVSMRIIAAPGNWDATRQVITTGESGNIKSPHWKDQLDAWYRGATPVFPFTRAAVKNATKEITVLNPQK